MDNKDMPAMQGNILDDFAMETPFGPEALRTYVKRYPKLAVELTDLYHELLMIELSSAAESTQSTGG